MSTRVYQCPCCGAPLAYDGGKLACASCGNAFDTDAIEAMTETTQTSVHFTQSHDAYTQDDAAAMSAYTCSNCGAELMTDATTTATECPYCGSPTILPGEIEASVKPARVVPFKITKEEAAAAFEGYFKGKKLLPNVFTEGRNRIAEMKKLFVPYWLFDCSADAAFTYSAERVHTRREGEWEVTVTEHYLLRRAGSLAFRPIPVDASVKLPDSITESLEPFDLSDAVPFTPAVLAGSMADRADADTALCEQRATERIENSVRSVFRETTLSYSGVSPLSQQVKAESGCATPVLLPVWLITTQKQENGETKTYTFAINGQTGRLTTDVEADMGKSLLWGGGVFAGVGAAAYLLLALASGTFALESGHWLLIAFIALIAALITVAILRGELKTARSKHEASDYVRRDTLRLNVSNDYYLFRTENRRRIEQPKKA